jgi:hypothetical protein
MQNLILKPTTAKVVSENYPYGFREKTTKTDYLEFSPKHGFRHCSTTVNPKTGRVNNPKKSTYYEIMLLGIDEVGHCKTLVLDFYDNERKDRSIKFLSEDQNFNLFTIEQMKFIYSTFIMYLKADIKAKCIYTGAKFDDLKPFYDNQIKEIFKGFNNPELNIFKNISFDWKGIENCSIKGFNPFVTSEPVNIFEL